jgi:hypothetical protein
MNPPLPPLLPCPECFCEQPDLKGDEDAFHIECPECGCLGPYRVNNEDACEEWNAIDRPLKRPQTYGTIFQDTSHRMEVSMSPRFIRLAIVRWLASHAAEVPGLIDLAKAIPAAGAGLPPTKAARPVWAATKPLGDKVVDIVDDFPIDEVSMLSDNQVDAEYVQLCQDMVGEQDISVKGVTIDQIVKLVEAIYTFLKMIGVVS